MTNKDSKLEQKGKESCILIHRIEPIEREMHVFREEDRPTQTPNGEPLEYSEGISVEMHGSWGRKKYRH